MPEMRVVLDRNPAWLDLAEKVKRGRVIHIANSPLEVTAVPHGMASGRASVALRIDLPDGRTVIAETSLRALWSATVALATKYGEDFMQVQPTNDTIEQMKILNAHLARQLIEAKTRLGEPKTINLEAADREWEERKRNGGVNGTHN